MTAFRVSTTTPDAAEYTFGISVCRCGSLLWSRVAHGGLQGCAAESEIPSFELTAEVVWCFDVFAAWVKCSHPVRPRTLEQISTASCGDSTSLPAKVFMRQHWRNPLNSACEVSTKVSDALLIASSN